MEKILFFIMLMGILSSLFGKSKPNKPQRRSRPVSFESFEEIKTVLTNEAKKRIKTVQPQYQRSVQDKQQGDLADQYSKAKQDFTEQVSNRSVARNAIKEDPVTIIEVSETEVKRDGDFSPNEPDPNMIINGIIWSEILAEPRSKNPYLPRKR